VGIHNVPDSIGKVTRGELRSIRHEVALQALRNSLWLALFCAERLRLQSLVDRLIVAIGEVDRLRTANDAAAKR